MALLRPIIPIAGTQINYIMFNSDWEVDAMTEGLHSLFKIDSESYQSKNSKMIFNLLTCAPRLLKFTRFNKFLNKDD